MYDDSARIAAALNWQVWQVGFLFVFSVQFDSEKPDKITRGACACNDDKVIFENPLNWTTRSKLNRRKGTLPVTNRNLTVWLITTCAFGRRIHVRLPRQSQRGKHPC